MRYRRSFIPIHASVSEADMLRRICLSCFLLRKVLACSDHLGPYVRDIFVLLFTRLTSAKSDRFMQAFCRTFFIPLAIRKPGLGPDELYQHVESLQAG